MKLRAFLILLLLIWLSGAKGQRDQLLFYNLENLFHPSDDTGRASDDAYTPEGQYDWTLHRYHRKLSGIFKTIAAIGKGRTPSIMGFAELEERRVLEELIEKTPLVRQRLCILQYPSPDHRGMDVGMIYRRDRFNPQFVKRLRVPLDEQKASPTREILYVKGLLRERIPLHVFVAHWPSRWGGRARTEWKRIRAAKRLKEELDSIEQRDPKAPIIVMGDLNDTPRDRSIREILEAGSKEKGNKPWYDLVNDLEKGSYFHRGHWSFLDHFLAPDHMIDPDSGSVSMIEEVQVHHLPWLLKERRGKGKKEMVPHRCYSGPAYTGGISDHLPISLTIRLSPK